MAKKTLYQIRDIDPFSPRSRPLAAKFKKEEPKPAPPVGRAHWVRVDVV